MNEDYLEAFRIWDKVHEEHNYEGIVISPEIRDSWDRSRKYGVDPYKPACEVVVSSAELAERKAKNRLLIEQALVMMGHLHRFNEGSGFTFILGDSDDVVLELIADPGTLEIAAMVGIRPGAKWTEEFMGTNSSSLASIFRRPIQLHGYEHYCRYLSFGNGSTCPIFDDEDNIIGFLSVTGTDPLYNRHTLGMAAAAARAVERQMALQSAYMQSEMANLHKTAIMDSISEGVLTLDRDGRVTHLNLQAAKNLGLDCDKAVGEKLSDIMAPGNDLFFAKISGNQRMFAEPLIVRRTGDTVKLAASCTPLRASSGIFGTAVILQPMQQYKQLIRRASGTRANITFDDIIGQSSEFSYSVKCARIAAKSDSNVLLLGESGVGKEMFAQSIHNASHRSKEPFYAINCAALPRELVSSELFGYEEGAFTGARKGGNPGKFELADQGTIFLDEIGEMPLELQGALLRVLEEGAVIRLGGTEVIPINVRIIAATNKNLAEEVEKRNFRMDLYYRLGVIDINIPPLRERTADIPMLAEHFIENIGPKLKKKVTGVDRQAMNILLNYHWPGNVRELSNIIERAINMADGPVLNADIFPAAIKKDLEKIVFQARPATVELDEKTVMNCLDKFGNNRSRTAKELGISRSSLYRILKKYSL